MKILAPAGNFECLKSAIFAGADEVYLGVNQFNARNNVNCFTASELESAVDFAHLYGVKVFLTLNILFSDKELNGAVDLAVHAYNVGVDAIIIQDVGLAEILSKNYPEIPLHASTQMGIHNLEGVNFLKRFNFKRVVLSRETPLSEIKRIKQNSSIEIEYFVHGALCVSFSGNCYLCSYLFNASGNRGRCKQLCRLNYSLYKENNKIKSGYLLSPKDFCLINQLKLLKEAGVTSLKIEGRARRPYYVYAVTNAYKKALNGEEFDKNSIDLAYNRGFTEGYLFGNENIISNYNNHVGVNIGKVVSFKKGNNFNEVYIESRYPITKKSVLKFYNNGKETDSVSAYDLTKTKDNLYRITGKFQKINAGQSVHLLTDGKKEDELYNLEKKASVNIKIFAYKNLPIKAEFLINHRLQSVTGETITQAKTSPLTKEQIENCFSKSNNFSANLEIDLEDNVFLVKSSLNEFRRKVFNEIENTITCFYKRNLPKISFSVSPTCNRFENFEYVENFNFKSNAKNVIYSPENYSLLDVTKFIKQAKSQGKTPYLDTPNFATEKDIKILKEIIDKTQIKIVANNPYALSLTKDYIVGGGLNVFNGETEKVYSSPFISSEGENSLRAYYMALRHCPFKQHLNADCKSCPYETGYYYKLDSGVKLKLKRKKLNTCTFYLTD